VTIIVIGLALPLVLYWLVLGRVPGVSVVEARKMLTSDATVLVNVSTIPKPALADLARTVDWPLVEILQTRDDGYVLPHGCYGRRMLLVCPSGVSAALATQHLRSIGVDNVFYVVGGWQEWFCADGWLPPGDIMEATPVSDQQLPAFRLSPWYEQWAAVAAFCVVKFFYTIVSAAIIIVLWRQTAPDLTALRWAMLSFFIGEAGCFFNVVVFREHSQLLEYSHNAGMVLTFSFTFYALLEAIDNRLIHYSDDQRCAAVGLCRACIKHTDVGCGLRRMFLMLVPATILVATVPLLASFRDTAYNTRILGMMHSYHHPVVEQIYEIRYLPIVAIVLLVACFLVLWLVERHPAPLSKILFSAAVGAIGFSYFRMVLVAVYVDNLVWFDWWEEATELLYTAFAGGLLIVFARGLGLPLTGKPPQATAAQEAA